jgi:hypothetical protein
VPQQHSSLFRLYVQIRVSLMLYTFSTASKVIISMCHFCALRKTTVNNTTLLRSKVRYILNKLCVRTKRLQYVSFRTSNFCLQSHTKLLSSLHDLSSCLYQALFYGIVDDDISPFVRQSFFYRDVSSVLL